MGDTLYEDTGLWRRALGEKRGKDPHRNARARLRASYEIFWRNTNLLVERVAADFPSLTLHNEAHLAALWQTADTIAGSKYELTPAEVFVLGGAILLHDAALTVHAYPGKRAELTTTTDWRDAVSAEAERQKKPASSFDWDDLDASVRDAALFSVVRKIHAKQAETMADFSVTKDGTQYHLLEDNTLRNHYGNVIGKIAASHHWPIEDLESKLQQQVNPLGEMPAEWTVDPVKLACLLRCADAAQIDQRRAPDFLYALLRLRGVSEQHWRAQNRLGKPVPFKSDPTALLYSSSKAFPDADADVWWLVYDLVTIVHRELQSCDKLLRETGRQPFAISSVRDAEAPTRLTNHIEVDGWSPVAAEVKVSDLNHLVTTLGGQELYGDDPSVPLREMIQNASDAVRARRLRDTGTSYTGMIAIQLEPAADSYWLHVDDDGVGMSERVLTGPLLDFGKSFWKSDLVESEFPGLRSSGHESTGRFGIGFFSVFMIADAVHVTSRRYEPGSAPPRRLEFRKGLALRPILVTNFASPLPTSLSTRVSIHISAKTLQQMLAEPKSINPDERKSVIPFTLAQRVARLAAGLDVEITVIDGTTGSRTLLRRMDSDAQSTLDWLRQILAAPALNDTNFDDFVQEAASRVEPISENGRLLGRAAIAVNHFDKGGSRVEFPDLYASLQTVGGLTASRSFRSILASFESLSGSVEGSAQLDLIFSSFVGVIQVACEGAVRAAGKSLAVPKTLAEWSSRQARLIADSALSAPAKISAIQNVRAFGGEARPLYHLAQLVASPTQPGTRRKTKLLPIQAFQQHVEKQTVVIFLCDRIVSKASEADKASKAQNDPVPIDRIRSDFDENKLSLNIERPPVFESDESIRLAAEGYDSSSVFVAEDSTYTHLEATSEIRNDRSRCVWLDCIASAWGAEPKHEILPLRGKYLVVFSR